MNSPITQITDLSVPPLQVPPSLAARVGSSIQAHMNTATYKDLVIFEDRLRGNMARLRKRRQKYEAFLGLLIVLIAYFCYAVFLNPFKNPTFQFIDRLILFVTVATMILFFATGMYREKVVYASKFVPQCNRALRSFNLYFNRDELGQLSFYRRIPKRFQEEFNTYRQLYYARKRGHAAPSTARGASTSSPHQSASSRETTPETGLPVIRSRPTAGEKKRNTGVRTKRGKARDMRLSIPGRETEESGRDTDRSE